MNILLTGGSGFIGSHTAVALLERGHDVIIADNLSNSSRDVIDKIEQITQKKIAFYQIDVCDINAFEKIFIDNKVDGIIHFCALKAVGESVGMPIEYYQNNLISTLNVLQMCKKYNVNKLVQSSSATVYGDAIPPALEDMPIADATNPYGQSKVICERFICDYANTNKDFKTTLLRYFNPVGAHKSGIIGESPNGIPNNITPVILNVLNGKADVLKVFGNDYDTPDGTAIRDYIHVLDLADAHVVAIENMISTLNIYNVGTGKGSSVLDVIAAFERVLSRKIPFEFAPRRAGDIAISYSDSSKIERELNWKAKYTLDDMARDAYNFSCKNM